MKNWLKVGLFTSKARGSKGELEIPPMPNYKEYVALLTQSGTDAPVATVLSNTIGNIVWTRVNVGSYDGILNGAFPSDKLIIPGFFSFHGDGTTSIKITDGYGSPSTVIGSYSIYRGNDNIISIVIEDASGEYAEWSSLLTNSKLSLVVRVYS